MSTASMKRGWTQPQELIRGSKATQAAIAIADQLLADVFVSEPHFGGGRDTGPSGAAFGAFAMLGGWDCALPGAEGYGLTDNFDDHPEQNPQAFDRIQHTPPIARSFVPAKTMAIADPLIADVIASARLLGDGGASRSSAAFSALAILGRGRVLFAGKSAEPGADGAQQRDDVAKPPHLHKRSPCKENPNQSEDEPQQQDRHYLQELHNIDYEHRRIVHAPPIAQRFIDANTKSRLAPPQSAGGNSYYLRGIQR